MPEHASAGESAPDDPFADSATRADGEPDYYAALGVRPTASDDEIRHAFHRLAKLWHPDRYMTAPPALRERAERRMRLLIAAHEALSDPIRRHVYDRRYGHPVAATSHSGHAHGHDGARSADGPHGARAEADRFTPAAHDTPDAATTGGNPNGAGQFFGLVLSVLTLSILVYVLTHGDGGFGSLVAIGAVFVLGGLAVWFFIEDSLPSRLATSWLEGAPTAYAASNGHHPKPYHRPHHKHRHGGHHTRPAPASPAEEPAATAPQEPASEEGEAGEESSAAFERLVGDALAHIPAEFQRYMENVVVRVQAEPSAEELESVGAREGGALLGLYHGVNLTHQGARGAPAPEEITIYQGPIERYCHGNPARIREQVRRTVLHELAHHFGIDHEDMPDWVR
jgi:predicted Zn-dependent protease with MMP-like domain